MSSLLNEMIAPYVMYGWYSSFRLANHTLWFQPECKYDTQYVSKYIQHRKYLTKGGPALFVILQRSAGARYPPLSAHKSIPNPQTPKSIPVIIPKVTAALYLVVIAITFTVLSLTIKNDDALPWIRMPINMGLVMFGMGVLCFLAGVYEWIKYKISLMTRGGKYFIDNQVGKKVGETSVLNYMVPKSTVKEIEEDYTQEPGIFDKIGLVGKVVLFDKGNSIVKHLKDATAGDIHRELKDNPNKIPLMFYSISTSYQGTHFVVLTATILAIVNSAFNQTDHVVESIGLVDPTNPILANSILFTLAAALIIAVNTCVAWLIWFSIRYTWQGIYKYMVRKLSANLNGDIRCEIIRSWLYNGVTSHAQVAYLTFAQSFKKECFEYLMIPVAFAMLVGFIIASITRIMQLDEDDDNPDSKSVRARYYYAFKSVMRTTTLIVIMVIACFVFMEFLGIMDVLPNLASYALTLVIIYLVFIVLVLAIAMIKTIMSIKE